MLWSHIESFKTVIPRTGVASLKFSGAKSFKGAKMFEWPPASWLRLWFHVMDNRYRSFKPTERLPLNIIAERFTCSCMRLNLKFSFKCWNFMESQSSPQWNFAWNFLSKIWVKGFDETHFETVEQSTCFKIFSMIWAVSFLFCQCWFLSQEKGMVHFAVFSMKFTEISNDGDSFSKKDFSHTTSFRIPANDKLFRADGFQSMWKNFPIRLCFLLVIYYRHYECSRSNISIFIAFFKQFTKEWQSLRKLEFSNETTLIAE